MRFLECIDGPFEGHVVQVPDNCRAVGVRAPRSRSRPTPYVVHRLGAGEFVLRHDVDPAPPTASDQGACIVEESLGEPED
jgi:hypothetical protein